VNPPPHRAIICRDERPVIRGQPDLALRLELEKLFPQEARRDNIATGQ
jgi:hypothetical protein